MSVKDEIKNATFFALILAGMVYVGKKLDKGWGALFGRGK